MTGLSAVLIVLDEERNLPAALQSLAFCDERLVVDGGSRDRTCEVAHAAGARVVVNQPFPGFVAQRNFAAAQATHDRVLALDADERVTPALRAAIEAERSAGFPMAGYRLARVAFYQGRFVRGTDWYPDPQLRLYDRRRGRFEGGLVHESARVDGPTGRLDGELEHYPYADVSAHLRKIDAYTTLWARQEHAAGRRAGMLGLLVAPAWAFVRNYVLKRGFLLGEVGLTVSALNSYYTYAKLAKLAELQRAER